MTTFLSYLIARAVIALGLTLALLELIKVMWNGMKRGGNGTS
jgi:hypothetical protein